MQTTGGSTVRTLESFSVPSFWCPYPAQRHPAAGQFAAAAQAFVHRWGLLAHEEHRAQLASSEVERLVEWTVPRGRTERMLAVVLLNVWYHALDDLFGDAHANIDSATAAAAVFTRLSHVLEAPEARSEAEDGFDGALREIIEMVAGMASGEQFLLWRTSVQSYLMLEVCEALDRDQERTPSLEQYIRHCIDGRAARASMLLLPIAGGYTVPPVEMNGPVLRALTEAASLAACIANDIYSFGKERHRPEHTYTLIRVLAQADGGDPSRAVMRAMILHDRVMGCFQRLAEQCESHPATTAEARRYMADLGSWLRGQLEWGLTSDRFAATDFRVSMPELFATEPITEDASGPRLEPIAWWWDVKP